MLETLRDASWEDEMNAVAIDPAVQARLNAQRTGDLQFRSVELQEILPKDTDLSAAEQMKGTGVTPLDVEVYSRSKGTNPEAVEMVEMKIGLSDLPPPNAAENNRMVPFEIAESDPFGGSRFRAVHGGELRRKHGLPGGVS